MFIAQCSIKNPRIAVCVLERYTNNLRSHALMFTSGLAVHISQAHVFMPSWLLPFSHQTSTGAQEALVWDQAAKLLAASSAAPSIGAQSVAGCHLSVDYPNNNGLSCACGTQGKIGVTIDVKLSAL